MSAFVAGPVFEFPGERFGEHGYHRVLQEIIDDEITGIEDTFIRCGYTWN